MNPSAKEKLSTIFEATQDSLQGISEGIGHGAAIATGAGINTAQNVTAKTEENIQQAARETPRSMQKLQKNVEETSQSIDENVEDVKEKGIAGKFGEMVERTKEEASSLYEGAKSNVCEMRKSSPDRPLGG